MKVFSQCQDNEKGSVLVVALVILVLLTIIGISATTTTNIETQIAGNEKSQKIAFYVADSGVPAAAKVISMVMEGGEDLDLGSTAVLGGDEALVDQVMGYVEYDSDHDVEFNLGAADRARVDIRRDRTETLAGGSVEYLTGTEGVGSGAAGGGVGGI
jgi:type II secretory pathway component PulK